MTDNDDIKFTIKTASKQTKEGSASKSVTGSGVRSPLVQQQRFEGRTVESKSSVKKSPNKAPNKSPNNSPNNMEAPATPPANISQIKDLHDRKHGLPTRVDGFVGVNYNMADSYRSRQVWTMLILMLMAVGGGYIAYQKVPAARKTMDRIAAGASEKFERFGHYKKSKSLAAKNNPKSALVSTSSASDTDQSDKFAQTDVFELCKNYVQRSGKYTVPVVTRFADCLILHDNHAMAEMTLKKFLPRIRKQNDVLLDSKGTGWATTGVFQFLYLANYLDKNDGENETLLRQRCERWTPTTSCVLKALQTKIHGHHKIAMNGLKVISRGERQLPPITRGLYWFTLGGVSLAEGKIRQAEDSFQNALTIIPTELKGVRRLLIERNMIASYRSGNQKRMRTLQEMAQRELRLFSPESKLKINVLTDLGLSDGSSKRMQAVLRTSHITAILRDSPGLMDIILSRALQYHLTNDVMLQVKRLQRYAAHSDKYAALGPSAKLWEARVLLMQQQDDKAYRVLQGESKWPDSYLANLLIGITLVRKGEAEAGHGADYFLKAYKQNARWPALYGVGISLLRGGRVNDVPAVLRDLKGLADSKEQTFWNEMLEGEYLLKRRQFQSAETVLKRTISQYPQYVTPWQLLAETYREMRKPDEARKAQAVADEISSKTSFYGTSEGLSFPLSPLVELDTTVASR